MTIRVKVWVKYAVYDKSGEERVLYYIQENIRYWVLYYMRYLWQARADIMNRCYVYTVYIRYTTKIWTVVYEYNIHVYTSYIRIGCCIYCGIL